MSRPDPRPARTRRQLFDAICALAESHDLNAVSVSEIARTAGVDRGSFYAHYADLNAFLETVSDQLIADFEQMTAAFETPTMYEGSVPLHAVPSLYRLAGAHPGLYRQLLHGARGSTFAPRLQQHMEAGFIRAAHLYGTTDPNGPVPLDVRARFATTGALGLVTHMLDHGRADDPDPYTLWAWELLTAMGLASPTMTQDSGETSDT